MKRIDNTNLFIIAEKEIAFKNKSSKHPRSICPVCAQNRQHPDDPSVSWDLTLKVGYCHHCNSRFKIDNDPMNFENRYGRKVKNINNGAPQDMREHLLPIEPETLSYLECRGISKETAMKAGICSRQTWKGCSWIHWIAFPFYNEKGRVVNVQYKMADLEHKEFMFEPDAQLIPWNIRSIYEDNANEPLYVTEGMMDALALMECGYKCVISVPNGAGSKMSVFDHYRDYIEKKFDYIVFAGDTDERGYELAVNFTKYFSGMDVCRVSWDEADINAKDANEVLMFVGVDAVRRCISAAEMENDNNLKMALSNEAALDNLYHNGIPEGLGIGLEGFDEIVRFQEGNLLLVTGYPGSGKSTFVNYIVMSMYRLYGWKTLFFSPEKQPQEYHEAEMISIITGKSFGCDNMDEVEYVAAKNFLRDKIMFLSEDVSNPNYIISIAHRAVRCMGIKMLVVDPFVYLDLPLVSGASETQKIAEVLKKLMFATRKLNIFVILVAHPRKPSSEGPVEPSLYEVSGSANFYNFCDAGIIMERLKSGNNLVKITCGKARRPFNGSLGSCQLAYDVSCGRYASCIKNGNVFTTEYRGFNRDSWVLCKSPVRDATLPFVDLPSVDEYIDPGEQ